MKAPAKAFPGRTALRAVTALMAAFLLAGLQIPGAARAEASAWKRLQEALDQAENGEVITLTGDITAQPEDSRLTVAAGRHITLDLNGCRLDRNQKEYKNNNGSVLFIEKGAVLTIRDSGETKGIITGGYHDNGKGFDPKEAPLRPGPHLGIQNVRERIENICGGTLTISSTVGEGTTVKIIIPDEGAGA